MLLIDDGAAPAASDLAEARARWPDNVQFEQVSIPTAAARRLLASWPLHWGADPRFGQPIHLAILGRSRFSEALLVHALRISGYGEQRSCFTLLSEAPESWERAFIQAYPQAHEIAEFRFRSLDGLDLASVPPITAAMVCCELAPAGAAQMPSEVGSVPESWPGSGPDSEAEAPAGAPVGAPDALSQARTLAERLLDMQQCSPPIFIEIGDATPNGELSDWDGQLIPISYRQLALDRAVLLDGKGDELAQVIHNHYRDTTEAQGRDPSLEPAGRPWSTLASSYRDANRHQADHLWAKLAMTDCQAVPESQVESFAFAPIEVERLAVIEHGRWAADRWLDGWSYAPTRDNQRKHHPQLIPYQQLSGPMKDLDRFAVRLVPTLLARSGLGVLRMLLIGLAPNRASPGAELPAARIAVLMRRVLRRLVSRYPDRALVIAATLEDQASRRFVDIAINEFGASFFLLLPQPLPGLLEGLDAASRLQTLALVARARRRISLSRPGDLERWLDQRAEILVELGETGQLANPGANPGEEHHKRVHIGPSTGLQWNFEY
ncbi:hypothetical protein CCR96_00290 [Halochromatium roseum]|nr:hypothetical protein [Halochromatium roseum]